MLKKHIDNLGFCLGVIGLLLFMFGLAEQDIDNKNLVMLFSALLFLASSLIQKEQFFIGLQSVVSIKAIMLFYEANQNYTLTLFIISSFIFAITYFSRSKISIEKVCAFIGLISLCLGTILCRDEPMIICGIFLAIYAIFSIQKGYSIGWIFLVLNILYVIVAANSQYGFY